MERVVEAADQIEMGQPWFCASVSRSSPNLRRRAVGMFLMAVAEAGENEGHPLGANEG
jgi:hypothetical protein